MRFTLGLLFLMLLAEIAGFAFVGRAIGVLPTVGLTVMASVAGLFLLRIQGAGILQRLAKESRAGGVPGRELVHGAMIVMAAMLLILPGFITDIIGLLLFMPFVRDFAWSFISRRIVFFQSRSTSYQTSGSARPNRDQAGPIIDLDDTDFERDPKTGSPWSITRDPKR